MGGRVLYGAGALEKSTTRMDNLSAYIMHVKKLVGLKAKTASWRAVHG